jgi:hypothetical protein
MTPNSTAEGRYAELSGMRDTYLDRARQASKLTIPSLIPESDDIKSSKLKTPFQSVGARGVNNLASKLLLALLPPNSPFFRLSVDTFTLKQMSTDPELKTVIEKSLGDVERAVMSEIETSGDRVVMFETLKHLITAGNALLYVGTTDTKVFHLNRYVCKRDPSGLVLEVIVKESVAPNALPEKYLGQLPPSEGDEKTLDLYTWIRRKGDKYLVHQEVKGKMVPGTKGSYPLDKTPWLALRFTRIDGEDYGRGYVEEYMGDLNSLERLSRAIVEGAAAAAKILFLVNPNGTTRAKTLAEAPNGSIREGDMNDIGVLQLNKAADFRVALETIQDIKERLSYAFLLNSSIQRKGERVTAEEIRYMASELEDALGGVYSILSLELQLPYVNRRMAIMQRDNRLPVLPKEIVKPTIVTGMEALGRGHDLRKLDMFIQGMAEAIGPEALQMYVNLDNYIQRRATAVGIDTEGLIKTKEQIAQEQQQAQMMGMVQQLGPDAMKMLGQAAQQQGAPPNAA